MLGTRKNTHWEGLWNIIKKFRNREYDDNLFYNDAVRQNLRVMRELAKSLLQYHEISGDNIQLIDWLAENRIELNSILAIVEPKIFSEWLRWKILQIWPRRDYRRAVFVDENNIVSPTMAEFIGWYAKQRKPIIKDDLERASDDLSDVKGFIENTHDRQKEIEAGIVNNTLLKHDKFKKIDLALKKIMNGGRKKKHDL